MCHSGGGKTGAPPSPGDPHFLRPEHSPEGHSFRVHWRPDVTEREDSVILPVSSCVPVTPEQDHVPNLCSESSKRGKNPPFSHSPGATGSSLCHCLHQFLVLPYWVTCSGCRNLGGLPAGQALPAHPPAWQMAPSASPTFLIIARDTAAGDMAGWVGVRREGGGWEGQGLG